MTGTDVRWQRSGVWPQTREFDRSDAFARMEAVTTPTATEVGVWQSETKSVVKTIATHYIMAPPWPSIVPQPELGRDEAWFWYCVLWKREPVTLADATNEPVPASPLERIRHDLVTRVRPPWFDNTTYWHVVAGLLSRDDVAQYVGDGSIFVHRVDGGASIITGWSDQVAFVESCYQTLVPRLGPSEWDAIATIVGDVTPTTLARKLEPPPNGRPRDELATQWLRMAAASGHFDRQILAVLPEALTVARFDVLHALRDPVHLANHAPRLGLHLRDPLMLEKWIDRFGATQQDWIIESINSATTKKVATPLVATLIKSFPADELAPLMGAIRECKAKSDVDKWHAKQSKKPGAKKSPRKQ